MPLENLYDLRTIKKIHVTILQNRMLEGTLNKLHDLCTIVKW